MTPEIYKEVYADIKPEPALLPHNLSEKNKIWFDLACNIQKLVEETRYVRGGNTTKSVTDELLKCMARCLIKILESQWERKPRPGEPGTSPEEFHKKFATMSLTLWNLTLAKAKAVKPFVKRVINEEEDVCEEEAESIVFDFFAQNSNPDLFGQQPESKTFPYFNEMLDSAGPEKTSERYNKALEEQTEGKDLPSEEHYKAIARAYKKHGDAMFDPENPNDMIVRMFVQKDFPINTDSENKP
jgi:hypothetical protein